MLFSTALLLVLTLSAQVDGGPQQDAADLAPPPGPTAADAPAELPHGGDEPAAGALPHALPSLDDDLLAHFGAAPAQPAPPPLRAWIAGRARGALDESRDRSPQDDLQAGVVLTGRAGARAAVGPHEARVALGEGGRIGQDLGTLTEVLVARPALPLLYEAAFVARTGVIGFDADVQVGRFPFVLADGRWIGAEPFDPRGRTLDGLAIASTTAPLRVVGGAFYLGPQDRFDAAAMSFFATLGAVFTSDALSIDGYGIAHRDGGAPGLGVFGATATTLGTRLAATLFDVTGALGLDGQLAFADGAAGAPGLSGHADASLRWAPRVVVFDVAGAPFIAVSGDVTGGQVTAGRSFRAPAPTQHARLGLLDAVAFDDVWSTALTVGLQTEAGLLLAVSGRATGVVDPNGVVRDPVGRVLPLASRDERVLLGEVDVELTVPIAEGARVEVGYAIGVGGPALPVGTATQRLFAGVAFAIDAAGRAEGLPAP